jgi:hypothetical protein
MFRRDPIFFAHFPAAALPHPRSFAFAGVGRLSLDHFATPKRTGLKSYLRLLPVMVKSFDYVTRCLNALSAGVKNGRGA